MRKSLSAAIGLALVLVAFALTLPAVSYGQASSGDHLVIDQDAGTNTNGALFTVNPVTGSRTIQVTFTGTDNVAVDHFECSLDGAGFSACSSPISYSNLRGGTHVFQVRAVDTAGHVDPTPAPSVGRLGQAREMSRRAGLRGLGG